MKTPAQPNARQDRGSIIITVVFLTAVMALLTASMITYSMSERRGNERNRLQLRAQNVAENIALYAAEQLTTKIYRLGTAPVGHFPWSGNSTSRVHMPTGNLSSTSNVLLSEFNSSDSGMEVRAAIEAASSYALVTDTTNPNFGLQVATARIPIIAKGTAALPPLGTMTSYVEQDMELALTPLFQFGMFYNMDLELYPSQDFTVTGPVHTNNSLMAHPDAGSTRSILFTDRVTASDYVIAYQSQKALTRYADGTNPSLTPASGNVSFTHTNGSTVVNLKNGSNQWRDCRWLTTTFPPTASQLSNFKTWATTTYNGNLRAGVHGVTKLVLPGIGSYKETDDASTTEDDRNNGRQIIESPNHKRYNGSSFAATTDSATLKQIKISWRAGLYIMVNPSSTMRTGLLPDGATTVYLLPRSYRCWLNKINNDGSHTVTEVVLPGQPSYGQGVGADGTLNTADDIMYQNDLPNRFTNTTAHGHNQILRIPTAANSWDAASATATIVDTTLPIRTSGYALTGGTGSTFPADASAAPYAADAYFFDLRRANGNGASSTTSGASSFGRAGLTFAPRPIAKIDFDMGRLKLMVDRVISDATASTGYKLDLPTAAGTDWNRCIYNSAATPASFGLGVKDTVSPFGFTVFPDASNQTRRDPFRLYYVPASPPTLPADPRSLVVSNTDLSAAWYDGVAVYIHSLDVEQRSQTSGVADRVDSGVRLWNGRGTAPTLTASGKTGCTVATNDAVYIVGHYNADGTINATTTDTANPGGYSAKYPDSASEKLCSVFGDALMILSQPTYTQSGSAGSYTYGQTAGWCDAKSALPIAGNATDWETAGGGSDDGVYNATAIRPGIYPNLNAPGSYGTSANTKLAAVATEVSTALVVGIVPSHHNPTGLTDRAPTSGTTGGGVYVTVGGKNGNNVNSGGANNFVRLLDNWSGVGLYIRGSIVGLFESRVAMEPFTHSRCYRAPGRYWGLHYNFSQANHDVPLEPIVLNATRLGFRRLTAAQYATRKTAIEAMTAIP
jgi:Tfp pilus assembly protein PilX